MLETESCFRTLEPRRAHGFLHCQKNSCYRCLWKSNSWCFLTWCYVYISWSNEFVPCWKWSRVKGQYSDTIGLVMESHNLRTGEGSWAIKHNHSSAPGIKLKCAVAILLGSEHLTLRGKLKYHNIMKTEELASREIWEKIKKDNGMVKINGDV